jgi:protein-tyrosine phosphatase
MKSIAPINESMNKTFYCLCAVCGENSTKYCKDCYKNLCIKCMEKDINFVVRKHNVCLECHDNICCYKNICYKCDILPYHMITENIGLGSSSSSYNDFDVILNVNFPENNTKENDITVQKINNKTIIHVGLLDNVNNDKIALDFLKKIIPVIYKLYNDKNILFHCFAGISRSSMFVVAYLSYSLKITIQEAHDMVKSKRRFIEINSGFIEALKEFNYWVQDFVCQTD